MNEQVQEFERYLQIAGGPEEAARRLGVTEGHISHIRNGRRRISPDLAIKIHMDTDGRVSAAKLVWGTGLIVQVYRGRFPPKPLSGRPRVFMMNHSAYDPTQWSMPMWCAHLSKILDWRQGLDVINTRVPEEYRESVTNHYRTVIRRHKRLGAKK